MTMSSRRPLRPSRIFLCMTIIIAELIPPLGSQESYNMNVTVDPIENVISQKVEQLDTSTVFTPTFSTTEVTTVNTEPSVTTTDLPPNDALNVTSLPDCQDYSSKSPEENSSTLIRHFGIQPMEYASVSHQGDVVSVEDLTFVNSTDSSLTVEWEPPKNHTITTRVQWYIVEWSNNAGANQCRSSNETRVYTIKNLAPCTKFNIGVTPYVDGKRGTKRMVSAKTRLIVNEDTLKLQIDKRSAYWLKTRWSLPSTECITEYHVTYCNNANCKTVVNVTTTYYNATDLKPCTEYNFTVAFLDQSDDFGSVSIIGDTEFKKPGAPTPIWTLAGNNNLTVLWTPPFDASCVDSYRVTISHDGSSQTGNTSSTNYTFSELESCSTYEVVVIAVDKNQDDSNSEIIESNQTLAPIPQSPQIETNISTNETIVLNWSFHINRTNNCSTIQITTECVVIEVLGIGYQGRNGTSSLNITDGNGHTTIHGLTPYTNYTCRSIATNSQGKSERSYAVNIITLDSVPSSPIPDIYNITHNNVTIKWDKPKYVPGKLTLFEVMFMWYYPFHRPEWCEKFSTVTEKVGNISGDTFSLTYDKIQPFSKYTVKIKAKTRAGWSAYSDGKEFQTYPGAPGPVSHIEFFTTESPQNPNVLEAYLKWGRPCLINADDIQSFNITAIGERPDFPRHLFTDMMDGSMKACANDTCTHRFKENRLREEYSYKFFIAGKVTNAPRLGEVIEIRGTFPAGIPSAPDVNYTNQITIDPYKIRRTTTTAAILLPLFPNTNGNIQCYAIIVSKSGYNQANSSRLNFVNGDWPEIASWYESMDVNFEIPYQATKCLSSSYVIDYGKFKAVKFIIGEDTECPDLSSNQHMRSYCNGPLKPDTWYDVRMRAFTNGGYRDSTKFTIKTNAELQVAVVIGTIFGILSLGILITTMLLIRKCTIHAVLRRFLHSDMPGSPVPTPFNRRKFIAHCQELADNPGKLSNEFQLLQTLSVDLQMPTNAACLQANRKKNRYTDILPYDFSRVKLETIDNDPNSDYINASFIKGCNGDEEYIACQGPKEETTYDFWRMIDQYDIKLIVMLTQLMEKNKEKCHQYYPTIRETFTYENMSIRCSSELDYRTYTQRTLILQKENEKRTILHLHFKDWPDHDVPEDFDAMINFCQIIRRHISVNRGLAVIHCSAGIGRTGTLIAIDILLQYIRENRKLDVFGTVYRLRHHRINMVQRESQYAYIYNCMRQVLKNPYFSKSYKPPSVDPITDNNANNKKKTTSMANLVSSLETLKKSRLSSSSIESVEQIYNSSTSTSFSSPKFDESSHLLHGLRFSKSTPAICSEPLENQIVRYNTVDFPIFELNNEMKEGISFRSLHESTKSDDTLNSIDENHQQLNRFMLSSIIDYDATVNEKLLDTSL